MESSVKYVDTDPRSDSYINEEDLLEYIEAGMLDLMLEYGHTLETAKRTSLEYFSELLDVAENEISSGKVRSIYDR